MLNDDVCGQGGSVKRMVLSALNAPRGPELRQEAQPGSKLTFISQDVLLKAALPRFRKQLFTVRDLGQDGGTGGRGGGGYREREGGRQAGRQRDMERQIWGERERETKVET